MASTTCLIAVVMLSMTAGCLAQECPFFGPSRVGSAKTNLANCTWYEYKSCCERAEVTAVFAEMLSLQDASQACRNRVNYMMCYFCDPNQRNFITGADRQATMCASFCDDLFGQCGGAKHNGAVINSRYASGRAFCEANFFRYQTSNSNCLKFNASAFSAAPSMHLQPMVLPMVITSAAVGFLHSIFH